MLSCPCHTGSVSHVASKCDGESHASLRQRHGRTHNAPANHSTVAASGGSASDHCTDDNVLTQQASDTVRGGTTDEATTKELPADGQASKDRHASSSVSFASSAQAFFSDDVVVAIMMCVVLTPRMDYGIILRSKGLYHYMCGYQQCDQQVYRSS